MPGAVVGAGAELACPVRAPARCLTFRREGARVEASGGWHGHRRWLCLHQDRESGGKDSAAAELAPGIGPPASSPAVVGDGARVGQAGACDDEPGGDADGQDGALPTALGGDRCYARSHRTESTGGGHECYLRVVARPVDLGVGYRVTVRVEHGDIELLHCSERQLQAVELESYRRHRLDAGGQLATGRPERRDCQ